MIDPTQRFSGRVENYARHRPAYPPALLAFLRDKCGLAPGAVVADLGSGTGILTAMLLDAGHRVIAVEPNREMREAAERLLGRREGFHSLDGTGEATTLPDASVDFITVAQAFHWFDRPRARREFQRILKPGGWVVLVWNERQTAATPFLKEYEVFLRRHAIDYHLVDHRQVGDSEVMEFFGTGRVVMTTLPNQQILDFDGLKGRLLSASYIPDLADPRSGPMLADLAGLFETHAEKGRVAMLYDTLVFCGRFS